MKNVMFLSGTRADYGKLKPLIRTLQEDSHYNVGIFVTGMHLLDRYGKTWHQIIEDFRELSIWPFPNQVDGDRPDEIFGRTLTGVTDAIHTFRPNLLVIHGDRIEALAGATAALFTNTLVAHIEGGEVSGTLDEMIRHSVTKLSDLHFVSNIIAHRRVVQLGEPASRVYEIGSPEADIMLSDTLPNLNETLNRYGIPFHDYAILIFHPVSTELKTIQNQTRNVVEFALKSQDNFVLIEPNNDPGNNIIREEFERVSSNTNFRLLPSMRFEYFATLLKNAKYIIGNSSSGVREAQLYGTPCINVGTRQNGRIRSTNVLSVAANLADMLNARRSALKIPRKETVAFGRGESGVNFKRVLDDPSTWFIAKQKEFVDVTGSE